MKKSKSSIYFRYEFSDEDGRPEGGDIFEFDTMADAQALAGEILKVAYSDGVSVNLTIGEETPFFGYLKTAGLSRKDAEKEMADADLLPSEAKASVKKVAKKSAQKSEKKRAKNSSKKATRKK